MRPDELRALSWEELVRRAEGLGVQRPRVLTQVELADEILKRTASPEKRASARGWVGRARDLLSRVVDRGLHLPEAAKLFSGAPRPAMPKAPPPLPTVTLAEIYAAQGHLERAIRVLDDVIAREPEHAEATAFRAELAIRLERELGAAPVATAAAPRSDEASDDVSDAAMAAGPSLDAVAPSPAVHAAAPADPPMAESPAAAADPPDQPPPPAVAEPRADAEPDTLRTTPPPATPSAAGGAIPPDRPSVVELETAAMEELEAATAELAAEARSLAEEEPEAAEVPPEERATAVPGDVLPEVYEVDEIVGLAVDPTTVYAYWEVRPARFARVRWHDPDGQLVIRVFTAHIVDGRSALHTWDHEVVPLAGDVFIRGLPAGCEVRLCLAWKAGDHFVPLAVAPELQMPRDREIHDALAVAEATGAQAASASEHRVDAPNFDRVRSVIERPRFEHGRPSTRQALVAVASGSARRVDGDARMPGVRSSTPGLIDVSGLGTTVGAAFDPVPVQRVRRRLRGGASDLYDVEEVVGGVRRRPGGASDLYGGASDLYGGASELYRS